MYSARDNKRDLKKCLTLLFKVNYGSHGVGMLFFELPDLENVTLDTKIIILAHIYFLRYRNILKKDA